MAGGVAFSRRLTQNGLKRCWFSLMIRPRDFRLFAVQVAAFTPSADELKTSQVLASLIPDFAELYDGEIISTPSPAKFEIYGEKYGIKIPQRVTLTSEDSRWKFEAVPERSDSHWVSQSRDDGTETLIAKCQACLDPLLRYPITNDIQIGRLALIVRRWLPHTDPALALASQFCKPGLVDEAEANAPFRHSQDFQLHNRKRYASSVDEIVINSWLRCRSDVLIHERAAITIEQDINTLSEELEGRAFRADQVSAYVQWAAEEADRILNLYFPE